MYEAGGRVDGARDISVGRIQQRAARRQPADAGQGEGSGEGAGGGGGYGVHVRPVGVYSVGPDGTRWHPALDLNRVILGGQVVAMVVALVGGWVLGRRRR